MQDDPFAVLGLPALAELTDDDVHAAWRRIAAATHPDREDGGDPARFGAAAAAYVLLRTPFGRGEALADLGEGTASGHPRRPGRARSPRHGWYPRRPWYAPRARYQRRGAHRLSTADLPARFRRAGDTRFRHGDDTRFRLGRATGIRVAGGAGGAGASHAAGPGTRHARAAGTRHAGGAGSPQASHARFLQASHARFLQASHARLGQAGYARYRLAGYVTLDRGLARPAGAAALGAAAAIAVVGWTPATIGLVTGALTVTAWGLWRRAWRDR